MIHSMKIRVLKNKSGILSGLVIPVEELSEVKGSLKNDTVFYRIVDELLKGNEIDPLKGEVLLSSGFTVAEAEDEAARITDKLYKDAFNKGIPMFYRDERTNDSSQFIRANPDGSEDLVSFNAITREYSLLRKLVPSGKGYWSYLIN